jgi:hypothetical protein
MPEPTKPVNGSFITISARPIMAIVSCQHCKWNAIAGDAVPMATQHLADQPGHTITVVGLSYVERTLAPGRRT